jgi:hypothetical protein
MIPNILNHPRLGPKNGYGSIGGVDDIRGTGSVCSFTARDLSQVIQNLSPVGS